MKEYHKIDTVFKRDPATNFKTILDGDYCTDEFRYLANNQWVFTEKVDGTNVRVIVEPAGTVRFGGKTDKASLPVFLFDKLTARFQPQQELLREMFSDGACLYGEGYGPRIQKGGGNYRKDVDFVLFDVRVGEWWLQRSAVEEIAKKLSLDIVPIIGYGTLPHMVQMARRGFSSTWGPFEAEGIVARPEVDLLARSARRIITKIKCRDFSEQKTIHEAVQATP